MALHVDRIPRQFFFQPTKDDKKITLPDPHPSMTPQEVQKFYSNQYPAIITGKFQGPEIKYNKDLKKDVATYSIISSPGTHG